MVDCPDCVVSMTNVDADGEEYECPCCGSEYCAVMAEFYEPPLYE